MVSIICRFKFAPFSLSCLASILFKESLSVILLIDSIRIAAPSGSGIPLDADMSRALQAMPFDKHDDKSPPDIPAIKVVFEEEEEEEEEKSFFSSVSSLYKLSLLSPLMSLDNIIGFLLESGMPSTGIPSNTTTSLTSLSLTHFTTVSNTE